MKWENKITEASYGQRHDAEKDHDGAMHCTELVVELWKHDATGRSFVSQPLTDQRDRFTRVGNLPTHQHHERKSEQQKEQSGDGVLDADHFVV